jgi:(E)-4-hydroxy-3-methylbut-2-enyl-diphosphate synthase
VVMREAMVESAVGSALRAEELGLPRDHIMLSCKMSGVQDLIASTACSPSAATTPASGPDRGRHGLQGHRRQHRGAVGAVAGGHRRHHPHLADAGPRRVAHPRGHRRAGDPADHGAAPFAPMVTACPGCGRTTSTVFQELAEDIQGYLREQMPVWRDTHPGVETMQVAVMGCVVNGPGESKQANIGISLPGTGEQPSAPVYIDGEKVTTLKGAGISERFKQMVRHDLENRTSLLLLPRRPRARRPGPAAARDRHALHRCAELRHGAARRPGRARPLGAVPRAHARHRDPDPARRCRTAFAATAST